MSKRAARAAGFPWLSPYLTVKDAERALDFYQKAFGFEKRMSMPGPDGKTGHVEMVWRDAVIMFGPECTSGGWESKAPATSGAPSPVTLYVYCENVDGLFERATAAGA